MFIRCRKFVYPFGVEGASLQALKGTQRKRDVYNFELHTRDHCLNITVLFRRHIRALEKSINSTPNAYSTHPSANYPILVFQTDAWMCRLISDFYKIVFGLTCLMSDYFTFSLVRAPLILFCFSRHCPIITP